MGGAPLFQHLGTHLISKIICGGNLLVSFDVLVIFKIFGDFE